MIGTVAEMAEIRKIEQDAAAPHSLGCFETYAEELVEQGDAETGDYDEILSDGRTLVASFHRDLAAGTAECTCQARYDALIED